MTQAAGLQEGHHEMPKKLERWPHQKLVLVVSYLPFSLFCVLGSFFSMLGCFYCWFQNVFLMFNYSCSNLLFTFLTTYMIY